MITKNTLKFFEFQNMDEYYSYILESKENGQHRQAKQFFQQLSEKQKNDFFDFVHTFVYYDIEHDNGEELTQLQQYFNNL